MTRATPTRRGVVLGAVASAAAATFDVSAAQAEPMHHEVQIRRFTFDPQHLVVRVGDYITWVNHDLAPHTATADEFGWDTGELARDGSANLRVTKDMEKTYFCVFHPHMKGSLEIA